MKKLLLLCAALFAVLAVTAGELKERIEALAGVRAVTELPAGPFAEKYEVMVEQPLDWQHPQAGTFRQRAILMHVGFDRPTIVITQGYAAGMALREAYRDEISALFDTNIAISTSRHPIRATGNTSRPKIRPATCTGS